MGWGVWRFCFFFEREGEGIMACGYLTLSYARHVVRYRRVHVCMYIVCIYPGTYGFPPLLGLTMGYDMALSNMAERFLLAIFPRASTTVAIGRLPQGFALEVVVADAFPLEQLMAEPLLPRKH